MSKKDLSGKLHCINAKRFSMPPAQERFFTEDAIAYKTLNCRCTLLPFIGDKPMQSKHEMYIEGVKAAIAAVKEDSYIKQYQPQRRDTGVVEHVITDGKLDAIVERLTEDS